MVTAVVDRLVTKHVITLIDENMGVHSSKTHKVLKTSTSFVVPPLPASSAAGPPTMASMVMPAPSGGAPITATPLVVAPASPEPSVPVPASAAADTSQWADANAIFGSFDAD